MRGRGSLASSKMFSSLMSRFATPCRDSPAARGMVEHQHARVRAEDELFEKLKVFRVHSQSAKDVRQTLSIAVQCATHSGELGAQSWQSLHGFRVQEVGALKCG